MATYVIAAGGTAGHVVPALAVADALRADGDDVVFLGGERAEATLVPAAGYELRRVRAEGISRTNPLRAARALWRAGGAVRAASGALAELRPAAVLGGGGYIAGVAGIAAVRRRVPLVLTEADSHLGLSNRLLARHAARLCLAFPIEGAPPTALVTGRPVPPPATDRAAARARFELAADETCVLVFGGSLGARSINHAAVAAFADAPYRVLHACGERDFATLRAPRPGYALHPYLERFGEAILAADLCVARAGGSVFEVAAHGRASVLVPYPHATADHQTGNARFFAERGAAVVVADAELTAARLRTEVDALLGDPARLRAMGEAARALARPDAAQVIARALRDAGTPGARPRGR